VDLFATLARRLAVLASAATLTACAALPAGPVDPVPLKPAVPPPSQIQTVVESPPPPLPPNIVLQETAPTPPADPATISTETRLDRLDQLPGWKAEDPIAALNGLMIGCRVTKDSDLKAICARAQSLNGADARLVRAFFEDNFRVEPIRGAGLLTGYYSPEYQARQTPDAEFSAPLRARPDDLLILDLAGLDEDPAAKRQIGRIEQGRFEPYPDRSEIERTGLGKPLLWMRPEDLFFLQIQGSGSALLPDGQRYRLIYEASNGRPFVGIAKTLREQGLLPDNGTSAEAIRQWLAANRGTKADQVMQTNPRYVYFSLGPDDGSEPVGAAGIALMPGRAVAIDPIQHRYGDLLWIDAGAPVLTGSFPLYQRLVSALDTGGAIKGEVRADLYLGRGDGPGLEAGRIRHNLTLYRLRPRTAPAQ
jgi:membrane-bound lytic murein transglycosylase A